MADAPVLCPRCCTFKPALTTLSHQHRGIIFRGCGDCLVNELDVLSSYRAAQCSTCGANKVVTRFDTGVQRLECPIHAHGRGLLGKALQALSHFETDERADKTRREIAALLGIKLPA